MSARSIAQSLFNLRRQFVDISVRAGALFGSMDDAALTKRPTAGSWCAAECLAHLNLSVDPYFPLWKEALARAAHTGDDAFQLDLWGRVLVWTLEPPPKFRFPAPKSFQPINIEQPQLVVPAFLKRQQSILQALDEAQGLATDKVKIVSPFARHVRYSVWSSFCVTAAHERRHIWQAERAAGMVEAGRREL